MRHGWMALMGAVLVWASLVGGISSAAAQVTGNATRDIDQYRCSAPASGERGTCVCRSPFACQEMIIDRVCRGTYRASIEQTSCVRGEGQCSCQWNGTGDRGAVDHRSENGETPRRNETVPSQRGTPNNETVPARRGDSVDHRNENDESSRQNETVPARRGTLAAPSQLMLGEVQPTSLTLVWMDNTIFEHGVAVERGTPTRERGGTNYHWEHVFNVEERVESRMEGTGLRSDGDDGLNPDTQYCYRLRAYRDDVFSEFSDPVCARTEP